jgi:outer membrane protein assembly factor BamB
MMIRVPRLVWLLLAAISTHVIAQNQPPATFQSNPQHTGVYDVKPLSHLQGVKFAFKTEGPIRSTPALRGGVLYFGSGDNTFYAVDAATGKEVWRFKTGAAVSSSPAVEDGLVHFVSRDGNLYAVDALKGKEVWRHTLGADLEYHNGFDYYLSSPTVVNGVLFVGSGDGNLYAFEANTGTIVWKYFAGSRIRSTPAVADNLVLVGTMSGYLVAVDRSGGTLKWKFATQGAALKIEDFGFDRSAIVSSPSVAAGIVTVGCRDGFLYAVDLQSGTQKWVNDHKISWVLSTPARSEGKVFAGSSDAQFIQAVDQTSGKELWRFKADGPVWSSAAVIGSLLYVASNDGSIHALDKNTGTERWRFKTDDKIFGSPIAADGMVYCGSDDGFMYALAGTSDPDTSVSHLKRAVFWDAKPGVSGRWFSAGTDEWIRDYFKGEGYQVVDAKGLEGFMKDQIGSGARSVVVFADHRVPPEVVREESEHALIRQYLNAGGKIVWLGPDPLAWKRDSTGKMMGINYAIPQKVLGLHYPGSQVEEIGWYGSRVTSEGTKWGLKDWWVGLGWIDARQVSTILAVDEYGKASSWVKNFGGGEGTGLVQLWIPRDRHIDLYPIRLAAEYGLR